MDKNSEGLIIITNDVEFFNNKLSSVNDYEKEYIVSADRPLADTFLEQMSSGLPIFEGSTEKCYIKKLDSHVFKIMVRAWTQWANS